MSIKWSIFWMAVYAVSIWIMSYILKFINIKNPLAYALLIGFGTTILYCLVRKFARHKEFIINRWFFFWAVFNTFVIWAGTLILVVLEINNSLLSLLLLGLALVISSNIMRNQRLEAA